MSIGPTGSRPNNYIGRKQKADSEDESSAVDSETPASPEVTRQTAQGEKPPQKKLSRFKVKQADDSDTSSVNNSSNDTGTNDSPTSGA